MSGRSDDAKEAKDIVYTGKEQPFEKFDRQVNAIDGVFERH